jgi:hypothetical protein
MLWLGCVLLGATYAGWPRNDPFPFFLEIAIRSVHSGFAQLYYDTGRGVNERDSSRLALQGRGQQLTYRFPLPAGNYANFRFDPTDRPRNAMTLSSARIVDRNGNIRLNIAPQQIKAARDMEMFEASATEVNLTTAANAIDPILAVELVEPIALKSFVQPSFKTLTRRFLIGFITAAATVLLTRRLAAILLVPVTAAALEAIAWKNRIVAWTQRHPRQLVLATAAVAVTLSCYPVIFFGRSFVSPNNHSHTFLLYDEMPTVPGYNEVGTDDEKGSDLGAAMWYSWPTSVVESRACFSDFELPLWNRYSSSGLPLLGQGQSMFGDPLHLLVLLTRGSAGWWDAKYVLAKFLFAACLGLSVLYLTKHLPAATVVAATSAFIGFYSYRYSHPAFFSISYAPSILFCWCKLLEQPRRHVSALWLGMLVLANWAVLNSGTVKEAYILLLAMNSCGALTLLLAKGDVYKFWKLAQAGVALVIFSLIATPVWLTFLHTLATSATSYDAGGASQLQPGLLVGLFDDIFYCQFNIDENRLDPSANFLILIAVLWFCFSSHRENSNRRALGAALTALSALALVFGVIPASVVLAIPFLNRIYHIDNTFSCVAIVALIVLAGFGVRAFVYDCRSGSFRRSYCRMLTGVIALTALYLGTTEAAQRSNIRFLQAGQPVPKSAFFWGYTLSLVAAAAILPWMARAFINRTGRHRFWPALALILAFGCLHWRFGMHLRTEFDPYVMNPQERAPLIADSSAAMNFITNHATDPWRVVGLRSNFFPGYGGAVGIEQIDSADPLLNPNYEKFMAASGVKLHFAATTGLKEEELPQVQPIFDMVNVRYFLTESTPKLELTKAIKKIAADDLDIYESATVWPRAFFTNRITPYGSDNDLVSLVRAGDGRPFAAMPENELSLLSDLRSLIEGPTVPPTREIAPASAYKLTTNTTAFTIKADRPGVAVLTEPYVANDFQLQMNGKPAKYFRLNSAFRGVFIPAAGEYRLEFTYWPAHFTMSLWIALGGLFLLGSWMFATSKYSDGRA